MGLRPIPPHPAWTHGAETAVELHQVVRNGRDGRNDLAVVPTAAPHRVGHECGQSIALLWDQVQRCGSLRCTRSGPERGRRCLLSSRQTSRCGDECLPARAAGLRSWCVSSVTTGGATAVVNAANGRIVKRSARLAGDIRAPERGDSHMPDERGGIASASARPGPGSRHCRPLPAPASTSTSTSTSAQIVTHQ